MTDILSQNEIDQLLSAISSGESTQEIDPYRQEKKVRIYDALRPVFLSKNNLIAVDIIAKEYARDLGVFLTQSFNMNINAHYHYSSQYTFEEFQRSVPKQTYLTTLNMMPLKGYGVVHIEPKAYEQIVKLLGKADSIKIDYSKEELSEVESSLVPIHTGLLRNAFSKLIDLRPLIENTNNNSFVLNFIEEKTMCLIMSFDIIFNLGANSFIESNIEICIPKTTLDPIKSKLDINYLTNPKKISLALDNIPIPVQVRYKDKPNIYLSDLENIKPGTVIKLKNKDLELCY